MAVSPHLGPPGDLAKETKLLTGKVVKNPSSPQHTQTHSYLWLCVCLLQAVPRCPLALQRPPPSPYPHPHLFPVSFVWNLKPLQLQCDSPCVIICFPTCSRSSPPRIHIPHGCKSPCLCHQVHVCPALPPLWKSLTFWTSLLDENLSTFSHLSVGCPVSKGQVTH